MSQQPPAGWYPDPVDPARRRWWDGATWAAESEPGDTPPAPAQAAGEWPSGGGAGQDASATPPAAPYGAQNPSQGYGAGAGYAGQNPGYGQSQGQWPSAAPAYVPVQPRNVDAKTDTIWVWLIIAASTLGILASLLFDFEGYFDFVIETAQSADESYIGDLDWLGSVGVISLLGLLFVVASIVFSYLDWRELQKRGIVRPFHWAFSFLILITGVPIVYLIGRSVVVKKQTGKGLLPLWVWIALTVIASIIVFTVVGAIFSDFALQISQLGY